jgi:hypothetical protein
LGEAKAGVNRVTGWSSCVLSSGCACCARGAAAQGFSVPTGRRLMAALKCVGIIDLRPATAAAPSPVSDRVVLSGGVVLGGVAGGAGGRLGAGGVGVAVGLGPLRGWRGVVRSRR